VTAEAPTYLAKPSKPKLNLPPGACDAHVHVFGPRGRFPFAEGRRYTPSDAPKEALFALHDFLGIERCVIVHTAAENVAQASSWYAMAAKNGDRMAAFELGLLYLDGDGVPKNHKRAGEWFQEAADKGYPPAEYNLALLHLEGVDASPSLVQAADLMKKAADAGLAEAQYDYGNMLIEGAGAGPDPSEGAREIGLAAKQGLVEAQVDYATLLYLGQGVARDLHEAVGWYERAANAGNAVGQNRYAKLLAVGEGVPLDLKQAAMWRALARRQGLNDPQLDKLLVSISPKDLADAEEMARFWPSPPPSADGSSKTAVSAEGAGTPLPSTLDIEGTNSSSSAASNAASEQN